MGKVSLKMQYLGSAHVGQDLCYYRIDIAENAVTVIRSDGYHARVVRHFEEAVEVESIKAKLRLFCARHRISGRIVLERRKPGCARILGYYPSRRWESGTGKISWMEGGSI